MSKLQLSVCALAMACASATTPETVDVRPPLRHFTRPPSFLPRGAQSEAARASVVLTEKENRTSRDELRDPRDAAIASLAVVAGVEQKEDRILISLSGTSLFGTGMSTLRPGASDILDRVAEALRHIKEPRMITIESHTDSIGSETDNEELSFRRADAVRSHLIHRGLTAHMDALGLGESRPIADNATAEGRAINRRLEIVVAPTRLRYFQ